MEVLKKTNNDSDYHQDVVDKLGMLFDTSGCKAQICDIIDPHIPKLAIELDETNFNYLMANAKL